MKTSSFRPCRIRSSSLRGRKASTALPAAEACMGMTSPRPTATRVSTWPQVSMVTQVWPLNRAKKVVSSVWWCSSSR